MQIIVSNASREGKDFTMTVIEVVIQDQDRTTTVRIKPLESSTTSISKVDDGNDGASTPPPSAAAKEIVTAALSPLDQQLKEQRISEDDDSDGEEHVGNKGEGNFLANLFKKIGSMCSSSSSST